MRSEMEIKKEFSSLACDLSPENLHCDGEISVTEARRKERKLLKRWRECEKELGRKVGEDEVWNWDIPRF